MSNGQTQFGPYQIIALLGEGAMGQVYRAYDPRLRREVALKILPPQRAADPDATSRMIRESRLVAALDHPGILSIYDVGEERGQFYLVTELLEGETLRARLGRGSLPWREALTGAVGIASALAAAHTRGIVHRDLKPENVMLTKTGVKVLDFGVAKYVAPPDVDTVAAGTLISEPGLSIGTPAYMSPEQLEGRAVDYRSDQFGFGIMLFEMITGRRPFAGVTAAEVGAAILRDAPTPPARVGSDIPEGLWRVIERCLAKAPSSRYDSTTDLALALEDIRAGANRAEPQRRARSWPVIAVALVAVLGASSAVLLWRTASTPAATPTSATRGQRTVAVLPFTTIGGGESYLADGITEAVTRELGHLDGTSVIAASSAFAYRGDDKALAQIGRDLGVEVMVRGSVQRVGDKVRIGASLIEAAHNATLWSDRYDRDIADVLAVQDDIAWQVASSLASSIGSRRPARPASKPKASPESYDAYLRGTAVLRGDSRTLDASARMTAATSEFERAIALDPGFALAHAALASIYTQRFFYDATDPEFERKAFLEIQRALGINPDQAEAYLARAQLTWNLRNGFPHERAIADLKRAIAANPSLAEAHVEIGKVYYHIGLVDKAIAANDEAIRLDPLSRVAVRRRLAAQIDGGMLDAVRDELSRNPQWPRTTQLLALMFVGRPDEALRAMGVEQADRGRLSKLDMNDVAAAAQLYAETRRPAEARAALAYAIPLAANPTGLSDTHHAQFAIGATFALLGEADTAVEWLTKAANEGYPSYPRFSSDPDLASLKNHAGFQALLARLRQDHERWRATL
ncbi:MAG TPA: protein kinase [Vicinamibacterales bacterium]|nr:protein kinase [Vicinamibacterales bacterium]